MRSLWSGVLRFGRVHIPVKLYAASHEATPGFEYLRRSDLCPIRYARLCRTTGEEVPFGDIVKGFEYRKGKYVVLEEKDFARAAVRRSNAIEIVDFVRQDEVDIKLMEKPFYLEPGQDAGKMYALLREALASSGRVGVAWFPMKQRERLGILKADGPVILLDQIRFAGEIADPSALALPDPEKDAVPEKELRLALKLIEQMSRPFTAEEYRDTYADELKTIIEDKAQGRARAATREKPLPTDVTELLSRLEESLVKTGNRG